jgi:hypothetical protein
MNSIDLSQEASAEDILLRRFVGPLSEVRTQAQATASQRNHVLVKKSLYW